MVQQLRESINFELPSRVGRIYDSRDSAITARLFGGMPISRAAAEVLCQRGLVAQDDSFFWRADPRLLVPSMVRLTAAQIAAVIAEIQSPLCILLAEEGIQQFRQAEVQQQRTLFSGARIEYLPGGHHFHMEQSAAPMAEIIQAFLEN